MDEERSLLQQLRLSFGVDYYNIAESETAKVTIAEYEAWWNNPATKAIRNVLLGDMAELSMGWADGANIDEEDPIKTAIRSSRAVAQMQSKHDLLALMFNLRHEVEEDEEEDET